MRSPLRPLRAESSLVIILFLMGLGTLCVASMPATTSAATNQPVVPNDTLFGRQNYLNQVNAGDAWRYTTGSSQVIIAIIDSGVDINHPDLKDNIWTNPGEIPGDGLDNDRDGYIDDVNGWDFINDIPDPKPKFTEGFLPTAINHGTLIAGIVAARGNNGFGITGVSWRSRLLPLRVLNNRGEGDAATVAKAIDYAITKKVQIINLSFVGNEDSVQLKAAIQRAVRAGILIVAAGGNDQSHQQGVDLDQSPLYPVCYDQSSTGVLGVGSTDPLGQKAQFSHYGSCIAIAAPGGDFFSTQVVNYEFIGFDQYYGGGWSGTSLSTGVVSGAAALLKSLNPRLSPQELVQYLKQTCDSTDPLNPFFAGKLGCGQINIGNAVAKLARDMNASVLSPELSTQVHGVLAVTDRGGQGPLVFTDRDGTKLREWYPFAPYKIPFSLARSSRGETLFVVGAGKGGAPQVRVFDKRLQLYSQFYAYDQAFRGGISVALGDVDGDGSNEIVTAPGPGGGPDIKIFTLDGKLKGQFLAYNAGFRAGVTLAVGDTDNDGIDDIVLTPAQNFAPDVRIFSDKGVLKEQFFAYPKTDRMAISLAVEDLNGDGTAEIITAPLAGKTPLVKIFTPSGVVKKSFLAFGANFLGGVALSTVDLNRDGTWQIAVAPVSGGGPQVRIFTPEGRVLSQFFVADPRDRRGLLLSSLSSLEL